MKSVLIAVFDGLQMSQVTPRLMPNLSALAAQGVTFNNHHSVFPTVTRTNVSSIVTGRYPGGHGLAANMLVVRDFDPERAIPAMGPELAQVAEATGRALLAPTLADILAGQGREYIAVGVGTTGNAYLHNPNAAHSSCGATIHPSFCLPHSLHEEIVGRFGPWPEKESPNTGQMAHAVDIMTGYIIPERNPAVSLIWFSEPDSAQHSEGVGSELSSSAVQSADRQFGRLMRWLEEEGRDAETDVMVVSDHGYSTIMEVVKVGDLVREAGFPEGGTPAGVVVAPNGGSVLFYAHDRDPGTCERLVAWLKAQPWCGALVASKEMGDITGALPAGLVGVEGVRAPDLAMSFRWEPGANEAGFPGHVYSSGGSPGVGQHGSMSPHELRNVLLAWGPSFKKGTSTDVPTGNVDIAPTALRILGVSGGEGMDGRALEEALGDGPDHHDVEWSNEVHTAEDGSYRQQITVSQVGTTGYVDRGGRVD
jgi:arylsulfatase A-like enzyme